MLRFSFLWAVGIILLFGIAPCQAQATRTFVSGVGDDANPCSRTAPCKTFAGAISKTAASGEINVLDPGGFGAVTITKAITIRSDSVEAGVLVAGTNGITVAAAASDKVVLEGLDFEGLKSGLNGVNVTSGGVVYIIRCAIRDFTGPSAGVGVSVASSTSGTRVFIKNSFIENNLIGVNLPGSGVPNSVAISDTLIDGNSTSAVQANGTSNSVALVRSILSGSPTGIDLTGGANLTSFGPSNVITGTTSPFTSAAYK